MRRTWLRLGPIGLLLLLGVSPLAGQTEKQYIVTVKTSSCENAGTDANVRFMMCGYAPFQAWWYISWWSTCTPWYWLDNPGCNDFEAGSIDTFDVRSDIDFTSINKIVVAHDNTGSKPGWLPEFIRITKDGTTWQFCLQRWLATDECDRSTTVIIDTMTQPLTSGCQCPQECFDPATCFVYGKQNPPAPNCPPNGPVSLWPPR